nr:hypothetical protein GCM10020092_025350 [Actinoplanes digitatis]
MTIVGFLIGPAVTVAVLTFFFNRRLNKEKAALDESVQKRLNDQKSMRRLVAPVAIFHLLQDRMTLVDLRLDEETRIQYWMAKQLAWTVTDAYSFAKCEPEPLPYKPQEEHPNQGLPSGVVEAASQSVIISGGTPRLASCGSASSAPASSRGPRSRRSAAANTTGGRAVRRPATGRSWPSRSMSPGTTWNRVTGPPCLDHYDRGMLIVSSDEIPGYRIEAVFGEVYGVTVRATNLGTGMAASFRSLNGGEVPEMTQLMVHSRNEAMSRMAWQAQQRQANAIVAFRFSNGELGQAWAEVCAYGTAVWVVPLTEHAKQQHEAMTRVGGLPHQVQHAGTGPSSPEKVSNQATARP